MGSTRIRTTLVNQTLAAYTDRWPGVSMTSIKGHVFTFHPFHAGGDTTDAVTSLKRAENKVPYCWATKMNSAYVKCRNLEKIFYTEVLRRRYTSTDAVPCKHSNRQFTTYFPYNMATATTVDRRASLSTHMHGCHYLFLRIVRALVI